MRILILIAALAMAACSSATVQPIEARSAPLKLSGKATLTVWGPYETGINLALAKLTAIAHTAAADLEAGRIDVRAARSINVTLARAEMALMAARRGDADHPSPENLLALAEAQRLLAIAASLLPEIGRASC